MRLYKIITSTTGQELRIGLPKVTCLEDISGFGYIDFQVLLYINGKYVADIAPVLDEAKQLVPMIDAINWEELYKEQCPELIEQD